MRVFPSVLSCLAVLAAQAQDQVAPGAKALPEPVQLTIKTLRSQMRYDLSRITVPPGARVKLSFVNEDDMPHNVVFCQPGTDVVALCAKMMEKPEEALKRNWLPDDPRVWLASRTLDPQKTEVLEFTAPKKPGSYPYVCSFPGHAMQMQGVMRVAPEGPVLSGLRFALYHGAFERLPNFATLKPHREGDIPSGRIALNFDDYKNEYAIVFTGTLKAPREATYTFDIASDDGSRLLVDGREIVSADGIHPATSIKSGKTKLTAGNHEFRLEYFQAKGEAQVFAAWEGGGFTKTALSEWKPAGWAKGPPKKEEILSGMPIVVGKEPVIYRNFITGAGNRGIGVGFPGQMNIAWSAESMNLAIAWRGAFIDAARHWNNRGGGAQPPLGFDAFRTSELAPPFAAVLAGGEWPKLDEQGRAEGYAWRGYRLDQQRIPTFMYEWNGVKISDRVAPVGDAVAGDGKLVRTLKLEGAIPQGALFRVASGTKITAQGSEYVIEGGPVEPELKTENRFTVKVDGARVEGTNLVLPARPEIVVTYSWIGGAHSDHHQHHQHEPKKVSAK